MSSVKLGWASAEVKDGELTVALAGEVPRGWSQSFERTVKLLGDGEWGAVELNEGTIQVSDVTPGTEEKLRHHLEAIVAQANATHERTEAESEDAAGRPDRKGDERNAADAEMIARFRAFAEQDEEEQAEEA